MNNITLATLFAEKFIAKIVPDNDPRKYCDYQFFIDAILKLIDDHPYVKDLISDENMTLSNVLAAIEGYFIQHQQARGLKKEELTELRRYVRNRSRFRSYETAPMFLSLGFSLLFVFCRFFNNHAAINNGAIKTPLEREYPDPDEPNPYFVMIDEQFESSQMELLYNMIENQNAPYSVIYAQMSLIDNYPLPCKKKEQ